MANNGEQMTKEELKQAKKEARQLLKKPFYKKWWVWTLAVLLLIGIATGGEETPVDATKEGTTETKKAVAKEKETKTEETKVEAKEEEKAEVKEEPKVAGIG